MAKLLFVSDLHLRLNPPAGRIDNWEETVRNKLLYLCNTATENQVDAILQAGDFFDKPDPSYTLLNSVFGILKMAGIPVYFVCGQHDLYMRSQDTNKSAIGILDRAGVLIRLGNERSIINDGFYNQCDVYGASFGDEIPEPEIHDEYNILIIHKMIGNKPLYPGHEITDAGKFLRDNPLFNIILCGDYHYPFHLKSSDGRHIVNTGCMLRLTRDERDMDRVPHFYIVDTETNEWKQFTFPHEPAEKVFSEKTTKTEIDREGIYQFIEKLKQKGNTGIRYMTVLQEYLKEHDVDNAVKSLIEEVLSERPS